MQCQWMEVAHDRLHMTEWNVVSPVSPVEDHPAVTVKAVLRFLV